MYPIYFLKKKKKKRDTICTIIHYILLEYIIMVVQLKSKATVLQKPQRQLTKKKH